MVDRRSYINCPVEDLAPGQSRMKVLQVPGIRETSLVFTGGVQEKRRRMERLCLQISSLEL